MSHSKKIRLADGTSARSAVWTRLGTDVAGQNLTAQDAFRTIGQYDVEQVDLDADYYGHRIPTGHRALFRSPTPDQPLEPDTAIMYGVVGPGYDVVTPHDLVGLLDATTANAPVSIIGAPRNGGLFFVGYDMPEWDVAGDSVTSRLIVSSPYSTKGAIMLQQVALRKVCINGMMAPVATESFAVAHRGSALKKLSKFLEGWWPRTIKRSQELQQALEFLASRSCTPTQARQAVNRLLPVPAAPKVTPDTITNDKRMQDWHYRVARVEKDRAGIMRLFTGEGQGMDTPAAHWTAFGLYNAVVEYYDHARELRNADSKAQDALFGKAANIKMQAFELAAKL